jgi:hypothetical protein
MSRISLKAEHFSELSVALTRLAKLSYITTHCIQLWIEGGC